MNPKYDCWWLFTTTTTCKCVLYGMCCDMVVDRASCNCVSRWTARSNPMAQELVDWIWISNDTHKRKLTGHAVELLNWTPLMPGNTHFDEITSVYNSDEDPLIKDRWRSILYICVCSVIGIKGQVTVISVSNWDHSCHGHYNLQNV